MGSSKCYMIWCRSKQFVVTIIVFFLQQTAYFTVFVMLWAIQFQLLISEKLLRWTMTPSTDFAKKHILYLMVWFICVCGVSFRNRERCCLHWLQKQIPPILALYYLSKTGGMPVFPVAHSSWIFCLKTFQNFDQWKFRSVHFFQLPFLLLASYLNAILIERKALHNYFFANCAYYLLVNRCNRSLRFIDPPTVCQKNKNMCTHASDFAGKAGCG